MKTDSNELLDFDEKQLRGNVFKLMRIADERGFIGITRDGKRVCYLVSSKLWQPGALGGSGFTGITRRGKIAAYVIPAFFWDMGVSFIAGFTPTARRKLPAIARTAASRDKQEATIFELRRNEI